MTGTEAVRLLQAPEYVGTILEALGHIQDARSESALIAAVERPHEKTPATVHDDAFRGLLQLWSARGVEAAIDALASFEKALAKRKKDDEPVRKGIGADLFVFVFEPLTPETVDELYEHLANAATTAGAPGPADGDGDRGSRWKSWFEQNRGLFTEKLGKATGVVDVTLRDRREKSTSKGGK
jgi:hypothetical protein